jgi:hypothetical protein
MFKLLRVLWAKKFFLLGFTVGFLASFGTLSLNRALSKETLKQQKSYEGTQDGAQHKLN